MAVPGMIFNYSNTTDIEAFSKYTFSVLYICTESEKTENGMSEEKYQCEASRPASQPVSEIGIAAVLLILQTLITTINQSPVRLVIRLSSSLLFCTEATTHLKA